MKPKRNGVRSGRESMPFLANRKIDPCGCAMRDDLRLMTLHEMKLYRLPFLAKCCFFL